MMGAFALVSAAMSETAAQIGAPFIHDPATIAECNGKYYTWGTGGGGLVSEDGWNWVSGERIANVGAAPDMLKIGDRYLLAYSTTGGGLGGTHRGSIVTCFVNTIDPEAPGYGFPAAADRNTVANSIDDEDCDAIDAGLLQGPDGRLWVVYGTYFGFIRQVELDPATGKRLESSEPVDVAIDCEAGAMMYRDGWYYLLGTHGTCCDGVNSTYNIIVGRSRNPRGPFLDNMGRDMVKGGGKLVVGSRDGFAGAGHFGRFIVTEGVEKMSFHWEADYSMGGRSTLAILPIVWKNGWPVAGENVKNGVYEIESERRGYGLELAVDYQRLNAARGGGMFGGGAAPAAAVEPQKLSDMIGSWPTGDIKVRLGDYQGRPHQKWQIEVAPDAGGYLGGAYYKIILSGTNRALAATAAKELITVPEFTGADEQLWRIDQLTDGTYRIMPKAVPGCDEELVLVSVADSSPSLGKFDFNSDNSKWNLRNW